MAKPIVAIVGRPNVGKSTLFNKLCGKRLAIVDDRPGVTRDRLYADCEWLDHRFLIVDTGGLEPFSDDVILSQMRLQAQIAIDRADAIIFVVDVRSGVVATDEEVAALLQKSGKPVILCVNKCDSLGEPPADFYEFYNLGLGDPIAVSSVHGHGTGDLLDEVVKHIAAVENEEEEDDDAIRVADTAGLRRKSKVDDQIEKYSVMRAVMAVERASVCGIMIDALEGFTEQDSKVAGIAHEAGKACIIAVNKWDAYEKDGHTMDAYRKSLMNDFSFMSYAPIIFISAKTGQRLSRMLELIKFVDDQNAMRIPTGRLNQVLADAQARVQPPTDKGKRLKIYYMTQASTRPPTFVAFVNSKDLFHYSYQRYLDNQIREVFGLEGTPTRLIIRERSEK